MIDKKNILDDALKMCTRIEENFVALGEMLSTIKLEKLYRLRGYESFKTFVEAEYHMTGAKAGKLVKVFDLFTGEMGMSEEDIKRLGYDKVSLIEPLVQKAEYQDREAWVDKADGMGLPELRETIKEYRDSKKPVDVKKVFTEQVMEKLQEWTNTSKKNLFYNIALYFQEANADEVLNIIAIQKRKFEAMFSGENQGGE